jgi:hypothetical protein
MWEKVDPGEVTKLIRTLPAELRELWPAITRVEAEEEELAERGKEPAGATALSSARQPRLQPDRE